MKPILLFVFIVAGCSSAHRLKSSGMKNDALLETLMHRESGLLDSILANKTALNAQVIYTQIDRGKNGVIRFTDHLFNVDTNRYFYPASTVKLPVAILALQRLNELNIPGLDKYRAMLTGSDSPEQTPMEADVSSKNGLPSIAHYIRKILLVSDNDAYNRLYEFLGQEYINTSLHKMGYKDVQLLHRLSLSLTPEQNRHTNPVRFADKNGKTIVEFPAAKNKMEFTARHDLQGKGYLLDTQLIHQPFDFSQKNRISLQDLHLILRSIIFPAAVPAQQRFQLTDDDYSFLQKYMSMAPSQSEFPKYDSAQYPDTYVKHWIYGTRGKTEDGVYVFNKTGTAYGYLLDIAYVHDRINNVEFLLSGVIYCNSDGIFNDDHYDYDSIGYPFFRQLGRAILNYERGGRK